MIRILHRQGRRGAEEGRGAAGLLSDALAPDVEPAVAGPEEREALLAGEGVAGAWGLLLGDDLMALPESALARCVVLPRLDPRWSLEDLVHRPLEALPPRTEVLTGSPLGAALLRLARPDLQPVRAGAFPLPEETPVLAEGPFDGGAAGRALDLGVFLPAPGTGLAVLVPPAGEEAPERVRGLADEEAETVLRIERAFLEGVGVLPEGVVVGGMARRKVSVMFGLRAVWIPAVGEARRVSADIPLGGARQFARGFGRHLSKA